MKPASVPSIAFGAVCLLLASIPVHAGLFPADPTTTDHVYLTGTYRCPFPQIEGITVNRTGNVIDVRVPVIGNICFDENIQEISVGYDLGTLAAGDYQVRLQHFNILAANNAPVGPLFAFDTTVTTGLSPRFAGSFKQDGVPGAEVQVLFEDENVVRVTWLTFQANNTSPLWIIGEGVAEDGENSVDLVLDTISGVTFNGPVNPDTGGTRSAFGGGTLRLDSCDAGALIYSSSRPGFGGGLFALNRQSSIQGLEPCQPDVDFIFDISDL